MYWSAEFKNWKEEETFEKRLYSYVGKSILCKVDDKDLRDDYKGRWKKGEFYKLKEIQQHGAGDVSIYIECENNPKVGTHTSLGSYTMVAMYFELVTLSEQRQKKIDIVLDTDNKDNNKDNGNN